MPPALLSFLGVVFLGAVTVTLQDAFFPDFTVTVMVVAPALFAVIFPQGLDNAAAPVLKWFQLK